MSAVCKTCHKPKANYACGICEEPICKTCTEFLTETFSFLKKVPVELTHSSYCTVCFDQSVRAPLDAYNETMEAAKEIIIYSKEQSKLTRGLKRLEDPLKVENCEDEEEALMRMSFDAVKMNFNALIDVQFKTSKIIIGSHKKTMVSATAVPVTLDPTQIRGHLDPP
jgi:hypothetical protein